MNRRSTWTLLGACALLLGLYALAGFALLPTLIERKAPTFAAERLGAELSVGDTRFNPFLLRLVAQDVRLARGGEPPMLTLERLVIDLEWASLWRRGWIVSDLLLQGAQARVAIGPDGRLNWAALVKRDEGKPEPSSPRVLVQHAAAKEGRLTLADLRGPVPASAALGSVEIEAFDLASWPAGDGQEPPLEGRYRLTAALPGAGAVSAQGSLALQPQLRSSGELALTQLSVPALWPLVRASFGLAVEPPAATLSAKARYAWSAASTALDTAALALDDVELQFTDVALRPSGSEAALLRLRTLAVHGGRIELAARELAAAEIVLSHGALALDRNREGRLNWQALGQPPQQGERPQPEPASAAKARPWQARIEALRVEDVALHAADHGRPIPLALDIAGVTGRTALALDFGAGAARTRLSALSARLDRPRLTPVGAAEPVLVVDTLSLAGGALDSGERRIAIDTITAQGGQVELELAVAGPPGLLQVLRSGQASDGSAPGWRYAIGAVHTDGVNLVARHRGFEPAIAYRAELAPASLSHIDSSAAASMRLEARLKFADGATLQTQATIAQSGASAEAELQLERLALLPLQPALARQARLQLRSGTLSAQARLELRRGEDAVLALRATGSATLDAVRIDEAVSGERFLAWRALQATGVVLDTAPGRLAIRDIDLQAPGAKLVIAEDNTVNLTQVIRDDTKPTATAAAQAPARPPFAVAIERIRIRQGVLDYADLSLVLPFSTQVIKLDGTVLGITTERGKRARVQAAGEIEPYGSARVNGSLLPFAPKQFLDLRVHMSNVAIPPLSPYTATFAGRKVAEGKLWLDLDYHIENGQLLGKNKIALADFRLGERVEAPKALDLPLDLAVALLTDEHGRIELAVPVRGEVGKPEFDLGAVVREALGNVLKRIVTAPFRALGRLFGGSDDARQLAEIEFRVGSDALMPEQREKLEAVARAIAKRPRLRLVVSGPYAPDLDDAALRRRAARLELARALGEENAAGAAPGLIDFDSERTRRALEDMLLRYAGAQALPALRSAPPAPPASESRKASEAGTGSAAQGGLYRQVFERIVQSYPLPDAAVQLLAARRAGAIRDYLVGKAGAPGERVGTGRIQRVEGASGSTVSTTLALDAIAPQPLARN